MPKIKLYIRNPKTSSLEPHNLEVKKEEIIKNPMPTVKYSYTNPYTKEKSIGSIALHLWNNL